MLCHGGAPIWTALTVETGEITGISFPTGKVGPGPIRTLINIQNKYTVYRIASALETRPQGFVWPLEGWLEMLKKIR
jgi:hypothetical protein